MTQVVSNPSADSEEKIEHAAKLLRGSKQSKNVFAFVYKGGKQCKTIAEMQKGLLGFNKNTYKSASKLAAGNILEKKGRSNYCKIPFYASNRDRILRLASNKKRLDAYPTKRKVISVGKNTSFIFQTRPKVKHIQIDDIASFSKVKDINGSNVVPVKQMAERVINAGICKILKSNEKKDWGGERNDIFSTNVVIKNRRIASSFALKGAGTKGILTPKKMGKNGDQLTRLFEGVAEVFFVVHNDNIHESIFDLMQTHAIRKSIETTKGIFFCIINGNDLGRLVAAYPDVFAQS